MRGCAFAGVVVVVLIAGARNLTAHSGKETQAERISHLIEQLGDDAFARREAASRELEAIGEPALPALRKAAASSDDIEIRRRAGKIVAGAAARSLAAAAKKEIEGLQGSWYSASTEASGVRQSEENKADRHFFSADQWVCKDGDAVVQTATIRIIEVSDKLVKIDFLITEGFRKGDTWVALYERSGDELKWCGGYVGEGQARPTTLTTTRGDGYFLRALKREKK